MLCNFAKYIENKWEIPLDTAFSLCSHYENGNSIYFLSEYVPNLAALGIDVIAEIYGFLDLQKELEPLREQARKTLRTIERYDDINEENILLSVSKVEIDDVVAQYKINSQSKGRAAIANGLLPLADLFAGEYYGDVNKEAEKYISKEKGLETADDVIDGVVAILTDRFAFDENSRIAIRNLTANEGSLEVVCKKKSAKLEKFNGNHDYGNITDDDICFLRFAEENKDVKVSISVPVLYALELLKQRFLEFENSASAGIVNRAISDALIKFLSPMAQNAVKDELFSQASEKLSIAISMQIRENLQSKLKSAHHNVLIISQNNEEKIDIILTNNSGELLRVSSEDVRQYGKAFNSAKIRNTFEQWRVSELILVENPQFADYINEVIELTVNSFIKKPKIKRVPADKKSSPLLKNEFVKNQAKDLEKDIQNIYATGITAIAPLSLIYEAEILKSFIDTPAVEWLDAEKLKKIIDRNLILIQFEQGIEIDGKNDNLLLKLGINEQLLSNMRSAKKYGTLKCKNDLKEIDGITQTLFNNISGFVIFPKAASILDKTLVHPIMFDLVEAMCSTLNTSLLEMVKDGNKISFYKSDNPINEFFICEKMAKHLTVGAKYLSLTGNYYFRMGWQDIVPGTITYGRVRNTTDFGVFVDINAATDGLIHISELPNTPKSIEEMYHPGDKVRVKILDVDSKKRKISLSMNFRQAKIPELLEYFNENL
jgi:uncharacterized protein